MDAKHELGGRACPPSTSGDAAAASGATARMDRRHAVRKHRALQSLHRTEGARGVHHDERAGILQTEEGAFSEEHGGGLLDVVGGWSLLAGVWLFVGEGKVQ